MNSPVQAVSFLSTEVILHYEPKQYMLKGKSPNITVPYCTA